MTAFRTTVEEAKLAGRAFVLPGVTDAVTARLVETLGFEAVYVTGAGLANARLGYPDLGLVTLTELVDHVGGLAETVEIPIVVDADTGYGNPLNVQRTVRLLERAGAAAIQLEDQVTPKRCGHFEGKEVVSAAEMIQKLHAAVDARKGDTVLIARTDAAAVLGLDAALERAEAYREAGADVLFVEAPRSREELARVPAEVPGTHLVNLVEGGKTPILARDELARLGFTILLYANSALRASLLAAREVLAHLREVGSTEAVADRIMSWDDRQDLVRTGSYEELERTYRTEEVLDGRG